MVRTSGRGDDMSFTQKLKQSSSNKMKKDDLGSSSNGAKPFDHDEYIDDSITERFSSNSNSEEKK